MQQILLRWTPTPPVSCNLPWPGLRSGCKVAVEPLKGVSTWTENTSNDFEGKLVRASIDSFTCDIVRSVSLYGPPCDRELLPGPTSQDPGSSLVTEFGGDNVIVLKWLDQERYSP